MSTKKSCVNCAFCLHCRDIFYGFPKSDWVHKRDNLTDNEISLIMNGDVSFLSEAKRKHDEWVATYEEKKEERRKKIEESRKKGSIMVGALFGEDFMASISETKSFSLLPGSNPYPLREEFGMEPCPVAPDHEYLECWKEVWGKEDENVWPILRSKRCANYYPLSKKETKTLKACDEERKDKADNRKFWRGAVVGFISAFVIMILRFLLIPYFTTTSNNDSSYPTEVEQQNVIDEPLTETQNNNISASDIQIEIKQDTIENNESEE